MGPMLGKEQRQEEAALGRSNHSHAREEVATLGGRARTRDEVAWSREWTIGEEGVEPGWREASIGDGGSTLGSKGSPRTKGG
jgi:hypothetical protein